MVARLVGLVALVLLVAVVALLVFLVPPHLQIARVEPPLPTAAELRELVGVDGGPVAVHYLVTSSQDTPQGTLGHNVFLIEWPNGDLVMLDAGMDHATATEFSGTVQRLFGGGPAQIHGTVRELLGPGVGRVRAVAFTHLHTDHTQGLTDFCEARGPGAELLQTVYQRDQHNFNTDRGAAIVAASCLGLRLIEADGVTTFASLPGFGVVPLGGHTPGSTLFAVGLGARLVLFSGDITNTLADIHEDRGKGFLYSWLLVPENTGRTAELRHWLKELDTAADIDVVVSHDLANVQRVLTPLPAN
jgi:glyoxylase-like metal-dependent hydrolase (beta-lactamase superfamily II)